MLRDAPQLVYKSRRMTAGDVQKDKAGTSLSLDAQVRNKRCVSKQYEYEHGVKFGKREYGRVGKSGFLDGNRHAMKAAIETKHIRLKTPQKCSIFPRKFL